MLCSAAGVVDEAVGSQVIKQTCNANDVFSTSFSAAAASSSSADAMALAAAAAAEQQRGYWNFAGHYPTNSHIQYPHSQHFQFLFPTAQTVDWSMGYQHAGAAQHQVAHLNHIPTHSPTLTAGSFANLHPLQQSATTESNSPSQNLSTLTLSSSLAQPLQVGSTYLEY